MGPVGRLAPTIVRGMEVCGVAIAAVALVTALGVPWSLLRVGSIRPTFVREAQFLVGLVALAAWTVRNRRVRRHTESGSDARPNQLAEHPHGRTGDAGAVPANDLDETAGHDTSLLVTGLLLVAVSLGGELLGSLPA